MTDQLSQLTRAKSLGEWQERSKYLVPALIPSIQHGLGYQAQPTDVFLSPMVKCGTTWLQQIVHTLRTRGDMDFVDILQVTPWVEMAQLLAQDLAAPQRGKFRVFKSHLTWKAIPKGGRYIVSFRDPIEALISDYNFVNGYSWEAGAVSLEQHAQMFMYNREGDGGWETNYWQHLVSWWEQRNNPQVLLLSYENMKLDLATTIKTIADFLNIDLDNELHDLTLYHTSRDFMLAHKSKFSGKLLQKALAELGYTPPSDSVSMVKKIRPNNQSLPEHIQTEMDYCWHKLVTEKTGISSYNELIQQLNSFSA